MQQNSLIGSMSYTVDLVFCIDSTMSMDPVLDRVKNNALNFYTDLSDALMMKHKNVHSVRIKLVSFRDYFADGDKAMLVTDFFNLPQESEEFALTLKGIQPNGGGDIPEDALEALGYAIRSDWSREEGTKKRQIIVLWSDAAAHPIGYSKSKGALSYPDGMARSFGELTEWWENEQLGFVNKKSKRLILYTPNKGKFFDAEKEFAWENIVNNWNNVIHFPSVAGKGLNEVNYDQILNAIVNSI